MRHKDTPFLLQFAPAWWRAAGGRLGWAIHKALTKFIILNNTKSNSCT